MKTCPICSAITFDDSMKCYGCLYDFPDCETQPETRGESETPLATEPLQAAFEAQSTPVSGALAQPETRDEILWSADIPPALMVKLTPKLESPGQCSWSCEVALAQWDA